jgi:hypothetical protein
MYVTNYNVVCKIVVPSKSICRNNIIKWQEKDVNGKWIYDWKCTVIGIVGKQKVARRNYVGKPVERKVASSHGKIETFGRQT